MFMYYMHFQMTKDFYRLINNSLTQPFVVKFSIRLNPDLDGISFFFNLEGI